MIPRYSLAPMAELFADEARYATWLEVELLAVEAQAKLGVVPPRRSPRSATRADIDVAAIEAARAGHRPRRRGVRRRRPGAGRTAARRLVHHGLTSSDVVDTALSVTLVRATDLLLDAVDELEAAIVARGARAPRHADGRPDARHPRRADDVRCQARALGAAAPARPRAPACGRALPSRSGKLSGAVGTYSNVDPEVEAFVCERLGLEPVPATQVIARDRHAELLYACASLGAAIETFALEIRHLQRTEVGEVEEPFRAGAQKGSSAMPHKRNPVKCEQLCGLRTGPARQRQPALEDIALWHERDISHSSVERIVLPDSLQLAYYMTVGSDRSSRGCVVHADRMRANLDASHGLVFSQAVLLALVEAGMTCDDAYRIVQRDAMRAVGRAAAVPRTCSRDDPEVDRRAVRRACSKACFDLEPCARSSAPHAAARRLRRWAPR